MEKNSSVIEDCDVLTDRQIAKTTSISKKPTIVSWKALAACSSAEARQLIDYELAKSLLVLPIQILKDSRGEQTLSLVVADSTSKEALAEISFAASMPIIADTAPAGQLAKAIAKAYGDAELSLSDALNKLKPKFSQQNIAVYQQLLSEVERQPIPLLLQALLKISLEQEISDLHLEPLPKCYRIRSRINGCLEKNEKLVFPAATATELISHIKVLCKLDTTKQSVVQEGAFSFFHAGCSIRLRVSIFPQINGEKVVLRFLDNNILSKSDLAGVSSFKFLGLTSHQELLLTTFLAVSEGTILLSGPTGSGKSTLLYAALDSLNHTSKNIVTIEDPVERLLEGLNQTEVNAKLGVDYHTLLGPLLRQDPDVIMLGEIRTKATAETALTAGITGHLVLSTVHAGNCFEVITRLRELGVSKQLISLSLKLIVAQRLIRTNCELCRIEAEISEKYLDFFKFPAGTILYTAKGCESCNFSGVSGRIGVFEFLPFTDQSRELLLRSSNDGLCSEFKELAYRAGYRPFSHGVREALLNGEISPHAALKTLGISPHFF